MILRVLDPTRYKTEVCGPSFYHTPKWIWTDHIPPLYEVALTYLYRVTVCFEFGSHLSLCAILTRLFILNEY